ncbi:MAG TPA: PEP/pyruvate-binding domain-containing protein, partial [Sphingobacteriaceae bacterium]
MSRYVYSLEDLGKTSLKISGGKGANLGELCRIKGIRVPGGFCLTTQAYHEVTHDHPELISLLDKLAPCRSEDREMIRAITARIRTVIEKIPVPAEMSAEIRDHLNRFREDEAFAVRSSATAEDLPTASFAGQQDTFLNIHGESEILKHIRKCWASLYTDRAVIYRIQNGFGHTKISLAVVIQQMIFADAAGTLFTADPVTSSRKVMSIDAGYGLGEALVSGLVNPDNYRVAAGKITAKSVSAKNLAIHAAPGGGTARYEIEPDRQNKQVLTDEQILQLEHLGSMIEAHFGRPQDIEWCLAGKIVYIVQSRPITNLFPVPEAPDQDRHVYLSVGHNQMMTDAMKPLGLSFFLLTTRAPMRKAGGRLFIDITHQLRSESGRESLINTIGKSDPLTRDALLRIFRRNFIEPLPSGPEQPVSAGAHSRPAETSAADPDPSLVSELIRRNQESIEELKHQIARRSGPPVFDFILEDLQQLKNVMFTPENLRVIMAAIDASSWINDHMLQWLGEKNAADTISQSVPHNITSAMGLELLDLADLIRPYPRVISYLEQVRDEDFLP